MFLKLLAIYLLSIPVAVKLVRERSMPNIVGYIPVVNTVLVGFGWLELTKQQWGNIQEDIATAIARFKGEESKNKTTPDDDAHAAPYKVEPRSSDDDDVK